jgi:hypothetical protein
MAASVPVVGAWFKTAEGELFEVVAWDPSDGVVEVQYFDGTVDEYDLESWSELEPRNAEPPEDWTGSLDLDRMELDDDLDRPAGGQHGNPLDEIDEAD